MANYHKGYQFEVRVREVLENAGLFVVRSGGSKKPDFMVAFPRRGDFKKEVMEKLPTALFDALYHSDTGFDVFLVECKKSKSKSAIRRALAEDKLAYEHFKATHNFSAISCQPGIKRGELDWRLMVK